MNDIEIYIKPTYKPDGATANTDWVKMDIDEGTIIALTFQLANIGDANIYTNRSNGIAFPKTANNLSNIQNAQLPNSAGITQYRKIETKVLMSGIDVLIDPYMIINNIKENIDTTIYSGNFNLVSTLAEYKLSDLDLSLYDLVWKAATVDSLKAVTSGVKYPLIDWFSDSPDDTGCPETLRTMFVKYYHPAIYLATLIDKIIVDNGFTYGSATSPVLLKQLFLKALIPCITHRSVDAEDMGYAEMTNVTGWVPNGYYDVMFDNIYAGSVNAFQFFELGGGAVPTKFNVTASGKYTMTYQHYIEKSFAGADWEDGFRVVDQGGNVLYFYYEVTPGVITSGTLTDVFEIDLTEGDIIHIETYFFNPNGATARYDEITWEISKNAGELVGIGTKFPIANNLPEIRQIDLLKWFLQMFGCFVKQTKDNTIWFKTIDEFIEDCGSPNNSIDWSDKFSPDEEPEIGFVTELAQKNKLKYVEDDPSVATRYDSELTVDDNTIQVENDFIQSPFAASEKNIRMNGLEFPSIKAIRNFEWSESFRPRILIDNTQTLTTGDLTVDDGFFTATLTKFNQCFFVNTATGNDLRMQSLVTKNYIGFSSVYLHPKIIKAKFYLSILDIYNLDQFIPIYVKQLGGYFIVMKVTNWNNIESTECELLKIQ